VHSGCTWLGPSASSAWCFRRVRGGRGVEAGPRGQAGGAARVRLTAARCRKGSPRGKHGYYQRLAILCLRYAGAPWASESLCWLGDGQERWRERTMAGAYRGGSLRHRWEHVG
jgi:hypothetical protein